MTQPQQGEEGGEGIIKEDEHEKDLICLESRLDRMDFGLCSQERLGSPRKEISLPEAAFYFNITL
jgi:hypothetical protein